MLLTSRMTKCIVKNKNTFIVRAITIVITLVFDLIFYTQMGYTQKDGQNRIGALFFTMNAVSFSTIQFMILSFNENTDQLIKELEGGLYRPMAHYLAVTIANLPWNFAFVLILVTPQFFINNNNFEHWYNFANWILINFAAFIVCESWGIFISVLGGTKERAIAILAPITQTLTTFAGFYISDKDVPVGLLPFKFLSFFRYIFLAMIHNEFDGINDCKTVDNVNLCEYIENYNAGWEVIYYVLMIFGITLVLKIISYIIFDARMKKYYG